MNDNSITVDKYFQYLNEGKLMGSKCPKCGQFFVTPRRLCGKCQVENEWSALSGDATLATFTIISVGNKAMVEKGYDRKKPYIFAVAQTSEGPKVSGLLLEVDPTKPDSVKIGMKLKIITEKTQTGKDDKGNPIIRTDVAFKPV